MATARNYRVSYRNIVKIVSASLVDIPFKFEYRAMGVGTEAFVASYDGENLINCAFGKNTDGTEDKSVIIVPINYIKIAPAGGAYVKRTFDGGVSETEFIAPNSGGDYASFAGYAAGGSLDDVEALKKEMREMLGNDSESESAQSAQIDSNKEVYGFFEGFDNTQKLKDVLPTEMSDEDYQSIRDLIK